MTAGLKVCSFMTLWTFSFCIFSTPIDLIGNISVLTKVPFLLPDKLPLEDGFYAAFLILLSRSTTLLIYGWLWDLWVKGTVLHLEAFANRLILTWLADEPLLFKAIFLIKVLPSLPLDWVRLLRGFLGDRRTQPLCKISKWGAVRSQGATI